MLTNCERSWFDPMYLCLVYNLPEVMGRGSYHVAIAPKALVLNKIIPAFEHTLFQHLLFTMSDISASPSENKNLYYKAQNYPSMTIFIMVYAQSYLMLPTLFLPT